MLIRFFFTLIGLLKSIVVAIPFNDISGSIFSDMMTLNGSSSIPSDATLLNRIWGSIFSGAAGIVSSGCFFFGSLFLAVGSHKPVFLLRLVPFGHFGPLFFFSVVFFFSHFPVALFRCVPFGQRFIGFWVTWDALGVVPSLFIIDIYIYQ